MPRRKFGRQITQRNVKTNNSPAAERAKIEMRLAVKEQLGGAGACRVLDCYAGDGVLHDACWADCASYTGIDKTWFRDERLMYVGDSPRVMRAIPLGGFNVFDIDAWGSPWENVAILMARRQLQPGEKIAVLLTEGTSLKLRLGGIPNALRILAKLRKGIPRPNSHRGDMIDRAIANMATTLQAKVIRRLEAQKKGTSGMTYIALVLERPDEKKGEPAGSPSSATARRRRAGPKRPPPPQEPAQATQGDPETGV